MENSLLKAYLSYIKIIKIIIYDAIILSDNKIIYNIINIINDHMKDNDLIIVKACLKIFFVISSYREELEFEDDDCLENFSKKFKDIIKITIDIMNNYPNEIQIIRICLNIIENFSHDTIYLDTIRELNILPKIIELTSSPDGDIICLALKIIGNFSMDENSIYTQIIIDLNVFDLLKKTIKKEYDNLNEGIRKKTAFILSNIAAGNQEQLVKRYESNFYDIINDIS